MSLEHDVTILREDEIFKPASKAELKKRKEMLFPFLLMRFYSGGSLAKFKWVKSNDDLLEGELQKFEEECDRSNEGERIGFLTPEEIDEIKRFL